MFVCCESAFVAVPLDKGEGAKEDWKDDEAEGGLWEGNGKKKRWWLILIFLQNARDFFGLQFLLGKDSIRLLFFLSPRFQCLNILFLF